MNLKRIRLLLWTSTVVLVAGTLVVASAAVRSLRTSGSSPTLNGVKPIATFASIRSTKTLPSLPELEALCQQDLRRPLYDAPPPVPIAAPPPAPPSPLPFKLAGTVIEPGRSQALLQMADGKLQFNRVGDSVGGSGTGDNGAQIIEITRESITLKYHGQQQVLSVEKKQPLKG
jgi:hypothetical protein